MANTFVIPFEDGNKDQADLLGGKGANLAEMTKIGIPVPYGFTIGTNTCIEFYNQKEKIWADLEQQIFSQLQDLEKKSGKQLGCRQNPLLVSVRSGAAVSMPGMMDTVLNLGLNYDTVEALAKNSGNARFAWDSFRRFVQMYANVVLEVEHHEFEKIITTEKQRLGKEKDTQMSAEDWKHVVEKFLYLVEQTQKKTFPLDPKQQLIGAIEAVFKSWNADRAIYYRDMNGLDHNMGTAVNIQMMVFGNLGDTSGTGVCFTRDPSTGEDIFYGEYLLNAQGEDVVAGIRTPHKIQELEAVMPKMYAELVALRANLEQHFAEMQDIEFTIENEKLFVLQTRTGKRSAAASLRIAVEMVSQGLITKDDALQKVSDDDIETLLHPRLNPEEKSKKIPLCIGLPASPGGVSGSIVFTAEEAVEAKKHEEYVILVRHETSPEDIAGMHASEGILTACGGMTSHAAVVARGMGRPCVSGASELKIDEKRGIVIIDNLTLKKGDMITIDGSTGEVFEGRINKIPPQVTEHFSTLLAWASDKKSLQVRTNADTPADVQRAIDFGAEGIGLCRTEHMFFDPLRIKQVQKMILTEDIGIQQDALQEIEKFQKEDFIEIFKILKGKPLCVRLLDPPLHEFLPTSDFEIQEFSKILSLSPQHIRDRIEYLSEVNPMLGHRGCRLLLTIPMLLEAQIKAILAAGQEVPDANIEIMIPLVSVTEEFTTLKDQIVKIAQNYTTKFALGTMIETPRACLRAEQIAKNADFFSFGTNDLTQMTFGFSRDDAGKFLPAYTRQDILENDPFQVVDINGVGRLIQMAVNGLPKEFKTSVCGEHGGNGDSIHFFHNTGIKIVSCSPFRVPVAIVAAGRAAISTPK